jgi:hypothetical protein
VIITIESPGIASARKPQDKRSAYPAENRIVVTDQNPDFQAPRTTERAAFDHIRRSRPSKACCQLLRVVVTDPSED